MLVPVCVHVCVRVSVFFTIYKQRYLLIIGNIIITKANFKQHIKSANMELGSVKQEVAQPDCIYLW